MRVQESVEVDSVRARPFAANAADRWNAVAAAALLMILAVLALVHLAISAAAS